MPAVPAALAAFLTTAAATATTAAASIGVSAGTSAFAIAAFKQIAVGVALSLASRALGVGQPDKPARPGTNLRLEYGEARPLSIIFGRAAVAGSRNYINSHKRGAGDNPNAWFTEVIDLCDWPIVGVDRCWVNGEWVNRIASADIYYGNPILQYRKSGKDYLWIKAYDGTQTAADPGLLAAYADEEVFAWDASMIGRGVAYAISTARLHPTLHHGIPQIRFECSGVRLYDPRDDSSVGGSGPQRWSNPGTWKFSENPAVIVYNILRGINDPITGAFVWGGRFIDDDNLPLSEWFAAMNACDAPRAIAGGGTEPAYRWGREVKIGPEDMGGETPIAVILDILRACHGDLTEIAGQYIMTVGDGGAPVFSFTDEDIIFSSPDEFAMFPGMDEVFNSVTATYPEPNNGWNPTDAPARNNASYLDQDGDHKKTADLSFAGVPYRRQIQRLMLGYLNDSRRFRRHTLVMPPAARYITPTDTVSWNSQRNGYSNKRFKVDLVEDLFPGGRHAWALREVDPSDIDWSSDYELPTTVGTGPRPPTLPVPIVDWYAEPSSIKDAGGVPIAPAIDLFWDPDVDEVTAVRWEGRMRDFPNQMPFKGMVGQEISATVESLMLIRPGEPALIREEEPVVVNVIGDVQRGQVTISEGIRRATHYEIRGRYVRSNGADDPWSDWLDVLTFDIRIPETEFSDEVRDRIDALEDAATTAADQATAALAAANAAAALVAGLSAEVIADLNALRLALGDLNSGDVLEFRGIALAGLRPGMVADPTFDAWETGAPTKWTTTGISAFGSRVSGSKEGTTALLVEIPPGSAVVNVAAGSATAGQMPAVDLAAEYVVVGIKCRIFAGSLGGFRLRAEWRATGASTYTRGHAFAENNSTGDGAVDWGLVVDPNRLQSKEVIFRKPVTTADAMLLWCSLKIASPTAGLTARIEALDVRVATQPEIDAHLSGAVARTMIDSYSVTLEGPGGVLAGIQDTLRGEFGPSLATVQSTVTVLASDVESLTGRVDAQESSFGDYNFFTNPQFLDGPRPAGQKPTGWISWPSTWLVVARAVGAPAPLHQAPTANVAKLPFTTVDREGQVASGISVTDQDRFSIRFRYSMGGSVRLGTMRVRLLFSGPDGAPLTPVAAGAVAVSGAGWSSFLLDNIAPPVGAAKLDIWVRQDGGGSGDFYATQFEVRKLDAAARATLVTTSVTATNALAAVTTLNTEISAEFGSVSSFIEQTSTAVAFADGFTASTWVLRQKSGAAVGDVEFVTANNPSGPPISHARISYDNIFLDGRVLIGKDIVIQSLTNEFPDENLQSLEGWDIDDLDYWSLRLNEQAFRGLNSLRFTDAGGTGISPAARSPQFSVDENAPYFVEYITRAITATQYNCRCIIFWLNEAGTIVDSVTLVNANETADTNRTKNATVTAPSGAKTAYLRWDSDRSFTNGTFRIGGFVVRAKRDGTTLITPESITSTLIAADTALFNKLSAGTTWVGTLSIDGDAVTIPTSFSRTADGPTADTDWTTILSTNVDVDFAGRIMVTVAVAFYAVDGSYSFTSYRSDWELEIDGTQVFYLQGVNALAEPNHLHEVVLVGEKAVSAGNRNVRVNFRKMPSEPSGRLFPRQWRTRGYAMTVKR